MGSGEADRGRSGFAIPVARSERGELVRPDRADPALEHTCPGCSLPVVLRRSEQRRAHFAHRGGTSCSSESVTHRAAKRLVAEVVERWRAGDGPRPAISRPCPEPGCDGGIVQDLPDDVSHAAEEVRLPGGLVADVVLFRGEEPAAAVEILVTSEVGHAKGTRLPVPWVELRGEDVLERPFW